MYVSAAFIILTFVVVIAAILLSDTIQSAASIVGLIASFFVILTHCHNLSKNTLSVGVTNEKLSSGKKRAVIEDLDFGSCGVGDSLCCGSMLPNSPTVNPQACDQNTNLYGSNYEEHQAYNTSYTDSYKQPQPYNVTCGDSSTGIDMANALMTQRRARDKKTSDGWASKNADYFKLHYGDELAESEGKLWWGTYDY